ncbi:unnamed protein product [Acanthoscelides obtectus]|uniref:Cycle n=1 Tax=Acanthoscelides obtectus TaxID=200917 RepID=A0A9P0KFM2_ACAOB|nr:unnamed protein product [Acanthoscelides obtectus]CAK1645467.1 Protein cycle [Acanthoscelides obtectus]
MKGTNKFYVCMMDNIKRCPSDICSRQNHSEVEKRRRDKMNTYITQLSAMVPMCHAMSRKLDKLTVLRMAVQHLKSIKGAVPSYTEGHYKPSFLSDQELKHLILQAADGFLFVVGCDRGRILYVSESVSKVLNFSQGDLLGQSLFDILHPKDVAKVKEQLSSLDLSPRERLIDAKTMLPVKTDVPQGASRLCPGARRSFFCRMKCKTTVQIKEEADTTTGYHRRRKHSSDKKYNVIQCTGYLKSWAPAKVGLHHPVHQRQDSTGGSDTQDSSGGGPECDNDGGGGDSCNLSCLVAVGRVLPDVTGAANRSPGLGSDVESHQQSERHRQNLQFVSRHALDGKFLFVDQRATLILGFLPQELLGTSMYEYYHNDDIRALADCHKMALKICDGAVTTGVYRFRTKTGSYVRLQSEWKSFRNPWTKEIENLIAKNSLILTDYGTVESTAERTDGIRENLDFFTHSNAKDIQMMINNHIEASKIGRQVAEQVLDSQRIRCESSSGSSPDPDESSLSLPMTSGESHISTNLQTDRTDGIRNYGLHPNFHDIRNNVSLSSVATDPVLGGSCSDEGAMMEILDGSGTTNGHDRGGSNGSAGHSAAVDGNDEAAMAVIMSLLEADCRPRGACGFFWDCRGHCLDLIRATPDVLPCRLICSLC